MKFHAIFFYLLVSITGYAQSGNYLLTHFSPDEERFNITCFDITQDDRGVFYFATQAGVLQFDGRNWDIIASMGTLYSIARSDDGQIYVAGSSGFGRIEKDELGMEIYRPLYNVKGAENVFQIITLSSNVYFLSDKTIFKYAPKSGEIETINTTDQTGSFLALHEILEKPYVSTESGLFEIESKKVIPTNFGFADSVSVIFSIPYNNQYLIGTDNNRLYIGTQNQSLQEIILQDAVYANAGVIVNATWVNERLIAVGTLRGGVIFFDPTTGATEEIINYNTGLPDNEVFALVCDKNKNVWAAHSYGFTRIAPFLPFRSFRYYPGLQGNLLCASTYKGTVYVGTSVGLFKLEKQEFFEEIVYYVEIPIKKQTTKQQREVEVSTPTADTKEAKRGLFGFLKKKRKEAEPTPQEATVDTSPQNLSTEISTREFTREKRTKRILRKAHFAYKPIQGIDSKITQLIHWNGKLIAAGLDGAFEINEKLTRIVQEPIRFLYASEKQNKLIASTYDDKLHQYAFTNQWVEGPLLKGINEPVNYIFEEDTSALWLCGFDKIFRVDLLQSDKPIKTLLIDKHNFDQLLGISLNKQVFIAATSGFYFYDPAKGALVEGDTLHKPIAYFASATNLWFRDKHSWYTAGQSGGHNNLQLLNLFSNIRFIDSDAEQRSLWVITGNNELLQFNSEAVRKDEILYPLILKSIENNNALLPKKSIVNIDQDNSAIKIEVVRPDFIGARFIEYRYLLQGLNTQWSEWSTSNNIIDFPYLPTGEYKLLIESKDIFGRVNELEVLTIDVKPPYWKQTWFYAAEFSVFLFLVILSFRLSYRFIFISRVLSLLSIIIFIEFIQTIAGSTFSTHSTPVFDFVIQVGVAFVVLPVEGFLRRYFLQAITKRNQVKLQKELGTDEEELVNSLKSKKATAVPEQD